MIGAKVGLRVAGQDAHWANALRYAAFLSATSVFLTPAHLVMRDVLGAVVDLVAIAWMFAYGVIFFRFGSESTSWRRAAAAVVTADLVALALIVPYALVGGIVAGFFAVGAAS